ncbi:tyrosine-type recombinase/integrase [Halodesulfurarchaeum sp.]|uniref:tyrosine-type recombinase/integrase n=1 Tax=Halodesulfurarchaeum sp. TaxID=1980530 RepID=UPI002FC39D06
MQLENYRDLDDRRVRLNDRERDRLLEVVENDTRKPLAFGLMAHSGLRSQELVDARREHLYQSEAGQWFIRVPAGKGDKERATPTSATLAGMIRAQEPGSLVEVTTRTIRRWVDVAAEEMADRENDKRWRYLGPHDLRRTWGHLTLEAEVLPSVVMQWGGWEDYPTFQRHYPGKHGEVVQSLEAEKVDWL